MKNITNALKLDRKANKAVNFLSVAALAIGLAFIILSLFAQVNTRLLTQAPSAINASTVQNATRNIIDNGTVGFLEYASFGTTFGVVAAVVIIIGLVALIKLKR